MFITEYNRPNQKLVRKPYVLPRIGEMMHKLEGFHYMTALDLNIEYYIIRLLPASQYMRTIVTEFGKFIYHHIPMGMCASCDIFQAKVD